MTRTRAQVAAMSLAVLAGVVAVACEKKQTGPDCSCGPLTDNLDSAEGEVRLKRLAQREVVPRPGCKEGWEVRCGRAAVKKALHECHYVIKIEALNTAAARGWKSFAPGMVRLLRHYAWTVREAAVKALLVLDPGQVTSRLTTLVKDRNPAVAQALLPAVGRHHAALLPEVYVTLHVGSEGKRYGRELLALGGAAGKAIRARLGDPQAKVTAHLLRALTALKDGEGLLMALTRREREMRLAALWELQRLKDPKTFKPIYRLTKGKDTRLAEQAIEVLGGMADADTALSLAVRLLDKSAPYVGATCEALGRLKAPKTLPILIKALGRKDTVGRLAVAQAIAKFAQPAARKALEEAARGETDVAFKAKLELLLGKKGENKGAPGAGAKKGK